MGWVVVDLCDEDGADAEPGEYKLWTPITGERDVGEDGAATLATEFYEWLEHRRLAGSVSSLKVSTDAQAVLVVYLGDGLSWHEPMARSIADLMRSFVGRSDDKQVVKAGWAMVAGSETLGCL